MLTSYGVLDNNQVFTYLDRLTHRVYKILPMYEEDCKTINDYVDSLVRELIGNSKIFFGDELSIITGTLKGLSFSSHKSTRSDIFKSLDIIEKMKVRLK